MSTENMSRSKPIMSALFVAGLAALLLLTLQQTMLKTQDAVHLSQQGYVQSVHKSVLTGIRYDRIAIVDPQFSASHPNQQARISELRQVFNQQEAVAWIASATTTAGYNGTIKLLIALSADLSIHAVRVIEHHETPGLGDKIDRQGSQWMNAFVGRSLKNTPQIAWQLRADGGEFDQFSGASVTPRAVVHAIHAVLKQLNQQLKLKFE